ncbi:MAG: 50S ribosomal protein L17 [Ignavibacteriae bacterium]|nr:50S ribosomal protein L17 [Ignavibacteriota bacterium]
MRHRKSGRKLKRTASHRRATLASLSSSLLRHKRITTTVAKAKETRMLVEKMITRAKNAAAASKDAPALGVHARREVGKYIKDRSVIKELFTTIAEKVATRPGGYTRIVKLGQRRGDAAEMAVIELVDFNTGQELSGKLELEKKVKAPRKKKAAGAKESKPAEESAAKAG